MNKNTFLFVILLFIYSFQLRKSDPIDHIEYLNQVNAIDSIYRLRNDTLTALKMYHSLFKKYPPHNSYLINEYQTYIVLSDKYHQDFGGKESLFRLIPLVAPNWKYNRMDKDFFTLYKKYGIDSLEVESEVRKWKSKLNKVLVDSFSIASVRDQEMARSDRDIMIKNDKKNEKLLIWTFNNYGYPSPQKIGLWNNDNRLIVDVILNHMAGTEHFPYFKQKILEYVKTGECTPQEYAEMIDKHGIITGKDFYGTFNNVLIRDSALVNRNRKKIGIPSLKHSKKIHIDYFGR